MMNRPEDSAPGMATVVELLGPLIDDRGSFTRTLAEVAAGEGVVLRPGALDQVGGGATAWALATLLEGHGRSDLAEGAEELARRVQREWEGMARSGLHRPAPGSTITWPSLRTGGAVLVLFGGEPDLARALLEDAGLGGETRLEVGGSGPEGLPRPDAIRRWMVRHHLAPGDVRALVRSPAAVLAAAAAGCGAVIGVGITEAAAETLPVTAMATDLAAALASG
ncbi:MAG: hypothetical protein KC544_08805 [Gemmatimonadetes bacterium]|nr:hypothetical protein [Gemmatimonadota bacterium]MCB9505731.1 hypothetical protein [Gemmatimonadales bacterium]MCB9518870.1 hypothetical protein [Gemmatimonadales bacterium]